MWRRKAVDVQKLWPECRRVHLSFYLWSRSRFWIVAQQQRNERDSRRFHYLYLRTWWNFIEFSHNFQMDFLRLCKFEKKILRISSRFPRNFRHIHNNTEAVEANPEASVAVASWTLLKYTPPRYVYPYSKREQFSAMSCSDSLWFISSFPYRFFAAENSATQQTK